MEYGKAKSGGPYGPGGVKAAMTKNPNKSTELNDAPKGPFSHELGCTDDGGMKGDTTCSSKGKSFHFK